MNTCKNCDNTFDENYCNVCGQKWITKRFTLKESISWLIGTIFNFDKGFFYTAKEVVVRPGKTNKNFLNGITIRYAHPFRFLFIWATISALIGVYLNIYEETGISFNQLAGQTEEDIARTKKMMLIMKQYMSFIVMGMIPFISIGTYLITKRKGFNYAEHLIINSFGNSSSIIIGFPIVLAYLFIEQHSILSACSLILGMIVNGRVLAQTVDDHVIIGILKYILSFLIGFMIMMLVMTITTIIVVLAMKSLGMANPFK